MMTHTTKRNSRPPEHLRLCHVHYPDNVQRRLARVDEPHVYSLNEWVKAARMDSRLPAGAGATIPWFDPESPGIAARVLMLLQDPSAVATGNRFISPHNCDDTARNTWDACADANLGYDLRCHWNVYPWWVNTDGADSTRPRMSLRDAAPIAASLLPAVMSLFKNINVIVLAGTGTIEGFRLAESAGFRVPAGVNVVEIASFSALGGFSRNRQRIVQRLTDVSDGLAAGRFRELRRAN